MFDFKKWSSCCRADRHPKAMVLYFTPTALSAFCPFLFSLQSFIYFSLSRYCFHFSACQGFPLHVFDFSILSPQGSLLSQLTDICQWRNITTIADVEMLIPSPLSPRLPLLQVCSTSPLVLCAAGSCFCPLNGADPVWSLWGPCYEQPITAVNPCWCVKPIRSRDPVA